MEHSYPHGDVDDLIYQEEWTVSSRSAAVTPRSSSPAGRRALSFLRWFKNRL